MHVGAWLFIGRVRGNGESERQPGERQREPERPEQKGKPELQCATTTQLGAFTGTFLFPCSKILYMMDQNHSITITASSALLPPLP